MNLTGRGTGGGGWATGASTTLAAIFCGESRKWWRTLVMMVAAEIRVRATASHPNSYDFATVSTQIAIFKRDKFTRISQTFIHSIIHHSFIPKN